MLSLCITYRILGAVIAIQISPQLSSYYDMTYIHSGYITAMCLSKDNSQIITGDSDGCIYISEMDLTGDGKGGMAASSSGGAAVANSSSPSKGGAAAAGGGGAAVGITSSFDFVDEVMIHKSTLEAKRKKIHDYTLMIEDLNANNDHQVRLKEMEHKARIKGITTEFTAELQEERYL